MLVVERHAPVVLVLLATTAPRLEQQRHEDVALLGLELDGPAIELFRVAGAVPSNTHSQPGVISRVTCRLFASSLTSTVGILCMPNLRSPIPGPSLARVPGDEGTYVPHLRGLGILKLDPDDRIIGTGSTLADVRRAVSGR